VSACVCSPTSRRFALCNRAIGPDQSVLEIDDQAPPASSTLAAIPYGHASAARDNHKGSEGQTGRHSAEPSRA
jgi:hypothetical protein